jgi:hypothetical protein
MSMKKHKYTVLSEKKCSKCGKILKQNLVDRIPNVKLCYACYCVSGACVNDSRPQGRNSRARKVNKIARSRRKDKLGKVATVHRTTNPFKKGHH